LTSQRTLLVEMRKRLPAQIRAHRKLGTVAMFEDVDTALKRRINSLIKAFEDRITRAIARDDHLLETAIVLRSILRSIPGIGLVAGTMPIAEMPEIGTITGQEAAALTGLAPVAHDSGPLRGKRAIAGGRRALRQVMLQAALVAAHHNPSPRTSADRLRTAGKPHKAIIAVARNLVTIANALCKAVRTGPPRRAERYSC
jgi:transposase